MNLSILNFPCHLRYLSSTNGDSKDAHNVWNLFWESWGIKQTTVASTQPLDQKDTWKAIQVTKVNGKMFITSSVLEQLMHWHPTEHWILFLLQLRGPVHPVVHLHFFAMKSPCYELQWWRSHCPKPDVMRDHPYCVICAKIIELWSACHHMWMMEHQWKNTVVSGYLPYRTKLCPLYLHHMLLLHTVCAGAEDKCLRMLSRKYAPTDLDKTQQFEHFPPILWW